MTKYTVAQEKLNKILFEHEGETVFGANQEWYPTKWQRTSGCGPTTAAVLFACFDDNTPPVRSKEQWLEHMQEWWKFITPSFMGVNRTCKYAYGADCFFIKRGLPYKSRTLDFPAGKRPPLSEVFSFIRDGLCENCPVAFLNLENGGAEGLTDWHWVTIVALSTDGGKASVTIFDECKMLEVDFMQWYDATCHSGGLVYFHKIR